MNIFRSYQRQVQESGSSSISAKNSPFLLTDELVSREGEDLGPRLRAEIRGEYASQPGSPREKLQYGLLSALSTTPVSRWGTHSAVLGAAVGRRTLTFITIGNAHAYALTPQGDLRHVAGRGEEFLEQTIMVKKREPQLPDLMSAEPTLILQNGRAENTQITPPSTLEERTSHYHAPLHHGDRYFLCSGRLLQHLDLSEIAYHLRTAPQAIQTINAIAMGREQSSSPPPYLLLTIKERTSWEAIAGTAALGLAVIAGSAFTAEYLTKTPAPVPAISKISSFLPPPVTDLLPRTPSLSVLERLVEQVRSSSTISQMCSAMDQHQQHSRIPTVAGRDGKVVGQEAINWCYAQAAEQVKEHSDVDATQLAHALAQDLFGIEIDTFSQDEEKLRQELPTCKEFK